MKNDVIVKIPNDIINPNSAEFSQEVFALATYAKNSGAGSYPTIENGVSFTTYEDIKSDLMSVAIVAFIYQNGGTVQNYKCYMKMTKEYAFNTDIPVGYPLSSITLENGDIIQKKWIDYIPHHELIIDDIEYIVKEDTDGVSLWSGSIIVDCFLNPNIEVLTATEFKALSDEE